MNVLDKRVILEWEDEGRSETMTLDELLRINEFSAWETSAILAAVVAGGVYIGGGGAAPLWSVRRAP